MSIELKQAAEQVLEAFDTFGEADDFASLFALTQKMNALRDTISQQPVTPEPVAWFVMNGVSKYQICGAKAPADALCYEMQMRHDLSGSLAAFHVLPLYTHPAPTMPEDSALLDYLDQLAYRAAGSDLHCLGGRVVLYVRTGIGSQVEASGAGTAREAIRSAMLAAKDASA